VNGSCLALFVLFVLLAPAAAGGRKKPKTNPPSYAAVTPAPIPQPPPSSPGSLYSSGGRLADLARDLRASRLNDVVTILVSDSASAVTSGATNTSRKSSAANSLAALAGVTRGSGPWANLANVSNNQQLQGTGTTSRTNTLNTTISAEVNAVAPNGNLIIVGRKAVNVNGENQVVLVRGTIRPEDVSPTNTVTSGQIANLEISINGKGVVADAVRRPFILYRLLLGLLPF